MPSYTKRKATSGPESLSPRELAYLWHKRTGLSNKAIANLWHTTIENVATKWTDIKKRLNVQILEEAVDLTVERLEKEVHALPLLGRMHKKSAKKPKFTWTKKRRRILTGLAAGMSRPELADCLGICAKTLSERIRRMKRYAGVKTVREFLAWAREAGMLEDNEPRLPDRP